MPFDFDQWMRRYHEEELDKIASNVNDLRQNYGNNASPVEVVQALYADKLRELGGAHAYSESGPLGVTVLLHRASVKELFPVPDRESLERLMGVQLNVLQWLAENRLVLLLIQNPERYRNITAVHPLLSGPFPPACYELRDRAVYSYLSQGIYGELVDRGSRHPVFGRDEPFPPALREPYETLLDRQNGRWGVRNAQRYAALAAVIGANELDEALGVPSRRPPTDEEVYAARSRFFYLHRRLLHPLTQGLGGLPYALSDAGSPMLSAKNSALPAEVETQLFESLDVSVPSVLTVPLIERVQASSLPEQFASVEVQLRRGLTAQELSESEIPTRAAAAIAELSEHAASLDGKVASRLHAGVKVVGAGGAVALARHAPELSGVLGGASGLIPQSSVTAVVDAFHRVFRRKYLPWQYWRLKREAASTFAATRRSNR